MPPISIVPLSAAQKGDVAVIRALLVFPNTRVKHAPLVVVVVVVSTEDTESLSNPGMGDTHVIMTLERNPKIGGASIIVAPF